MKWPCPEIGGFHMVMNGVADGSYSEVGLGILTFGVPTAFRALLDEFTIAGASSDAFAKFAAVTNVGNDIKDVLSSSNISFDGVTVYGSTYSDKFIIIGRNMDDRILPAADALKAYGLLVDYWNGFLGLFDRGCQSIGEQRMDPIKRSRRDIPLSIYGLDPKYTRLRQSSIWAIFTVWRQKPFQMLPGNINLRETP